MPDRLAGLRKDYAARILRLAGVVDARLEAAFAAVPREGYAGAPLWRVAGGLIGLSAERDLACVYDDVLLAIDGRRGINNGQPSLHARCIAALRLGDGETVVQVGAGTGYYTAILAHLVGPAGKLFAYEIEADLAERARRNLAGFPQVEVRAGSGVADTLPAADAIYVNAAASHPARAWLAALNPGGRLMFPLQAAHSSGAMLTIERPIEESDAWPARLAMGVVFIACGGAQDPAIARRLDAAYRRGGADRVRRLKFGPAEAGEVWLQGDGWALTTEVAETAEGRRPS